MKISKRISRASTASYIVAYGHSETKNKRFRRCSVREGSSASWASSSGVWCWPWLPVLLLLWQFVELGSLREVKGLVALLVGRTVGESYGENERDQKVKTGMARTGCVYILH